MKKRALLMTAAIELTRFCGPALTGEPWGCDAEATARSARTSLLCKVLKLGETTDRLATAQAGRFEPRRAGSDDQPAYRQAAYGATREGRPLSHGFRLAGQGTPPPRALREAP